MERGETVKILVCDDEADRVGELLEQLDDGGMADQAVPLAGSDLTDTLTTFFHSVKKCLDDPANFDGPRAVVFDDYDIGLFDNRLSHLKLGGPPLTAEAVVGYVRAFTRMPYTVSLNKNPDVDFDLRYLVGDYETRADLALNTEHLSRACLWTAARGEGADFRPWYWPRLPRAAERRRKQIELVLRHWRDPLLAVLQLPTDEQSLSFLSLHPRSALSPNVDSHGIEDRKGIDELRFCDVFLAKSRSIPTERDRRKISDALENPAEVSAFLSNLAARVVAADLDLWMRRDIIGPQEMLVDVPHLLLRMPFLLGDAAGDIAAWNAAVFSETAPFGMDPLLYEEHIADAVYHGSEWVESPAFKWPDLKNNQKLNDLFFLQTTRRWADVVFCEDTSTFETRSVGSGGAVVREFEAEFEGPWKRRFVSRIADIQYKPTGRLAGVSSSH